MLAQRSARPQIVDGTEPPVSLERRPVVQALIAEAFREAQAINVIMSRVPSHHGTDLSEWFVRVEVAKIASKLLGEAQTCFQR